MHFLYSQSDLKFKKIYGTVLVYAQVFLEHKIIIVEFINIK